MLTHICSVINHAYVEDPPTAAAATINRMHTLANLPFAYHFHFEHLSFTSHLHWLPTSHGINAYIFYFTILFYLDLKYGDHITQTKFLIKIKINMWLKQVEVWWY